MRRIGDMVDAAVQSARQQNPSSSIPATPRAPGKHVFVAAVESAQLQEEQAARGRGGPHQGRPFAVGAQEGRSESVARQAAAEAAGERVVVQGRGPVQQDQGSLHVRRLAGRAGRQLDPLLRDAAGESLLLVVEMLTVTQIPGKAASSTRWNGTAG
jgi:hypothetical protein